MFNSTMGWCSIQCLQCPKVVRPQLYCILYSDPYYTMTSRRDRSTRGYEVHLRRGV